MPGELTALMGAVSLAGRPVADLLGHDVRRSMASVYAGSQHEFNEVECGPVWLRCSSRNLVGDDDRCLAVDSWVAPGGSAVRDILNRELAAARDQSALPTPEGQYALAYTDLRAGRVTLLRTISGGERLYYAQIWRPCRFCRLVAIHPGPSEASSHAEQECGQRGAAHGHD
ncbi:MAG: hypothetical protein QF672_14625 [SAR202 cluster bacterium]|nr:hypothetical protein [SAR202 cluster bacterium]